MNCAMCGSSQYILEFNKSYPIQINDTSYICLECICRKLRLFFGNNYLEILSQVEKQEDAHMEYLHQSSNLMFEIAEKIEKKHGLEITRKFIDDYDYEGEGNHEK